MLVAQVVGFGGPEVLVPATVPDPAPGQGQVVVRVALASVTYVETQIRAGADRWHRRPSLPYVPGGLVAGDVVAVGEGADPAWLGRRVLGRTGNSGGLAELAAVDVECLTPVPDGLTSADAIALHGDGSTALGLVVGVALGPGDRVLVEAAAGGVGTLLVQLARLAGAHVIGAARGQWKLDLVTELGADAVDYSRPEWTEVVLELTAGAGPDVVFDGVGGEIGAAAFSTLAPGGRFSIHGAASGTPTAPDVTQVRRRGIEVLGLEQLAGFVTHRDAWAADMMAKAAGGVVHPIIGQVFPLARASEAHAAVGARRTLGKTLVSTRAGDVVGTLR